MGRRFRGVELNTIPSKDNLGSAVPTRCKNHHTGAVNWGGPGFTRGQIHKLFQCAAQTWQAEKAVDCHVIGFLKLGKLHKRLASMHFEFLDKVSCWLLKYLSIWTKSFT